MCANNKERNDGGEYEREAGEEVESSLGGHWAGTGESHARLLFCPVLSPCRSARFVYHPLLSFSLSLSLLFVSGQLGLLIRFFFYHGVHHSLAVRFRLATYP